MGNSYKSGEKLYKKTRGGGGHRYFRGTLDIFQGFESSSRETRIIRHTVRACAGLNRLRNARDLTRELGSRSLFRARYLRGHLRGVITCPRCGGYFPYVTSGPLVRVARMFLLRLCDEPIKAMNNKHAMRGRNESARITWI